MKTEQTIFDSMSNEKTDIILVDLISKKDEILTNPKVIESLDNGKSYSIRAKNLIKSFPTLASLEDMSIYRAIKGKSGLTVVLMPSIFKTEDNFLKVCLPDDNASITEVLKIDSIYLSSEEDCFCILTDGKDCFLKCSLSIDKTTLKRYEISDNLSLGSYTLESLPKNLINIFRDRPKLEIPLGNLELNKTYVIVANSGKSKQYGTPLISIKDETGKLFENVITNANLEKNGKIGRSFKIIRSESYIKTTKDTKGKSKEEKQSKYFIQWLDEPALIIEN